MSLKARRIRRAAARRGNGGQPTRPRATALDRLRGAQVHQWIAELEPWGILLALVGFVFAFYQFYDERTARQEDRATYRAELERQNEIFEAEEADRRQNRINVALANLAGGFGRRDAIDTLVRNTVDLRRLQAPNAFLPGADLSDCGGAPCDLSRADLTDAVLIGAQMEGAGLSGARMEGAVLIEAQMEGAGLSGARMQGADLSGARMEGAKLFRARMEGAVLIGARMEVVVLSGARMEGADLSWAQIRSANWTAATLRGAAVQFADLRGAHGLTQDQLESVIGNARTLLPEGLHVWSCWTDPPPNAVQVFIVEAWSSEKTAEELAADATCAEGEDPRPVGTQLPLDATPPWEEADISSSE